MKRISKPGPNAVHTKWNTTVVLCNKASHQPIYDPLNHTLFFFFFFWRVVIAELYSADMQLTIMHSTLQITRYACFTSMSSGLFMLDVDISTPHPRLNEPIIPMIQDCWEVSTKKLEKSTFRLISTVSKQFYNKFYSQQRGMDVLLCKSSVAVILQTKWQQERKFCFCTSHYIPLTIRRNIRCCTTETPNALQHPEGYLDRNDRDKERERVQDSTNICSASDGMLTIFTLLSIQLDLVTSSNFKSQVE